MVVNLVNGLTDSMYEPHLCVTRQLGPLKTVVNPEVFILSLGRKKRIDIRAFRECFSYVRANKIHLIHAHSTSIFFALLLAFFARDLVVLWHVHRGDGTQYLDSYEKLFYRWAAYNSNGVACVSMKLKEWVTTLKSIDKFVWYLPNFVMHSEAFSSGNAIELPGEKGNRAICVSNLRRQKDHLTLLEAWKRVIRQRPESHLFLAGAPIEKQYSQDVLAVIKEPIFDGHITWLGECFDIPSLLKECQVGVLSSRSEGFPLSLLEYGYAKLGVVTTDVGQCAEILDYGKAGLLIPSGDPILLGDALIALLTNASLRQHLGTCLAEHVSRNFSQNAVLNRLYDIYAELVPHQTKDQ
jgi:glycosyltransferase involved in cell wall biosynthesis